MSEELPSSLQSEIFRGQRISNTAASKKYAFCQTDNVQLLFVGLLHCFYVMRLFCPLPVLLKEIIKDWPNDNIAHRFGNSQNVMLHWQEFKVYSFCICIVEYDNDFENLKI